MPHITTNRWLNTFDDEDLETRFRSEMLRAIEEHGHFNSTHEIYGVLQEELDEFLESAKANNPDPGELLQLAAAAYVAVLDLCASGRVLTYRASSNESLDSQVAARGRIVGMPFPRALLKARENVAKSGHDFVGDDPMVACGVEGCNQNAYAAVHGDSWKRLSRS